MMMLRGNVRVLSDAARLASAPCKRAGSTLSSLAYMLIDAEASGRVTLTAMSYDVGLRVVVECEVLAPGCVLVPGAAFASAIASFPAVATVQLHASAHALQVECGRSRMTLTTRDAAEAPAFLSARTVPLVTVPAAIFARILDVCAPFVSHDAHRPAMGGIQIEIAPDETVAVATDGFALARCAVKWGPSKLSMLLPLVAAQDIRAALDRTGADDVEIETVEGKDHELLIRVGDTRVCCRLIDERFPDWRRIIPAKLAGAAVDRRVWLSVLHRVDVIADDAVRITCKDGALSILTVNANAEVAADAFESDDEHAAFPTLFVDSARLRRAMAVFNSDALTLAVSGGMAPIALTSLEDPAVTVILSPMDSAKLKGWPE